MCCFQQHNDHRQEIHPAADPSAGWQCSKQKTRYTRKTVNILRGRTPEFNIYTSYTPMKEVMAKTVQYAAKEVRGCKGGDVLFYNT